MFWQIRVRGRKLGTYFNRMEPGPPHLQLDLRTNEWSTSRFIRHQGESPTAKLCVPMSRSRSSGSERIVVGLEQMAIHLPVSTSSSTTKSSFKTTQLQRYRNPSRPILCTIKLAPQPARALSISSSPSQRTFIVSEHQDREGLPSRPERFSSSRVATIRQGLIASGFDEETAEIYLKLHKKSSTRQYQSIWTKFLKFIRKNSITHQSVTVATICNFLAFEASQNRKQYRTLSAYRCALRLPILWSCKLDINCSTSEQFLRGLFNYNPPNKASPMPLWNLNVLLEFLQSPKFEPLEHAQYSCLVQKTLCLILLASGRRISEVANISRSSQLTSSGKAIELHWVPGFTPKHFGAGFRPTCPSIAYLATDASTDLTLCPIRAYRIFLDRSSSWKQSNEGNDSVLWTSPKHSSPMSINQLTKLFIGLVKDSQNSYGLSLPRSIGPHQMRKLAASLSHLVGQDENTVRTNMGFSSVTILRKNYVAKTQTPKLACVLPGGPFIPKSQSTLSDSD